MRLLYFTDTHICGANPKYRLDDYPSTLRAKLHEVVAIAHARQVDLVLHGGDVFDAPIPPLEVTGEFMQILNGFGVPLFAVAGNHDIYAYDPKTLDRTMLGLLAKLGHFRLLGPEPVYFEAKGLRLQLTGTHFHQGIDRGNLRADYCVRKHDCAFAVHTAHGMILSHPMHPSTPHTLGEDIARHTEADLTLGSHAHFGFDPITVDGRTVVNPGALVRLSPHPADMERRPQVLLVDFGSGKAVLECIPLAAAKPGKTVVDSRAADRFASQEAALGDYFRSLTWSNTAEDAVKDLARERSLPPEVYDMAVSHLNKTRREEPE